MKLSRNCQTCVLLAILAGVFACEPLFAQAKKPARAKVNWRKIEAGIQAHNAARVDNGGRVSIELIGKNSSLDRRSLPLHSADGNTHTRCVVIGLPYKFRIELVDKLPISEINFICSDYDTEQTPKDVEITLSDGTVIKKTLSVDRPRRRQRGNLPRQRVAINRDISWVEVKVLSNHPGKNHPRTGKPINWGGIGEIEVITTADLAKYLTVPDFNAGAPTYIRGASPRNDYSNVKVSMPSRIPLGERPGIFLTRPEIVKMREEMKRDPRAQAMMKKLITACDKWATKKIVFPDPKIPAQMRNRWDRQANAHDLLSKMAGWLGWAYQLADDEKYAAKAREILLGYAKLYPNDYREHKGVNSSDTGKVMAQRLSEAMWLLPIIQSYDMIYNAKSMTDADRKLIETDLIRHAIRFINRKTASDEVAKRDRSDPNWRTTVPKKTRNVVGNWTNFYNAAFIQGGIVLGEKDWIDIGAANTRSNIINGIGDDGMWGEGAIGYHLFGRQALVACAEPLARKGIDVYGMAGSRFKNLFDSPLKYAYPDGTAPGINDSSRAPIGKGWTAMAYDLAYLRYGDPNYGSIVNAAPRQVFQSAACYFPTMIYRKLPERTLQGFKSLVFSNLGYAILRGADGGSQTFLLMDYGPHGAGHGHPDKLNLILFADGDELAGEPQVFRYENSRYRDWTRPTIAHWTMSVDEQSQAPTKGRLIAFHDAGEIKVMRGVSGKAYAGVALDRTVIQMPGYIVDVYRAWGPAKHTFDYPLCFRGSLDALKGVDPASLKPMGSPTKRGYKHIMITPPEKIEGNWSGTWFRPAAEANPKSKSPDEQRKHPANEVKAIVLGGTGTTVHTGVVPGGRHQVVLRRRGKEAIFTAVIDPYRTSDAVKSVSAMKIDGPVVAQGLKILRNDGGTDFIIVRFDQQAGGKPAAASTSPIGRTNALVSVIRLDASGKVIRAGMIGGTEISIGGKLIKRLARPGSFFTGE